MINKLMAMRRPMTIIHDDFMSLGLCGYGNLLP